MINPNLLGTFPWVAPLFLAGAARGPRAAGRTGPGLRLAGTGYASFLPLFLVFGFT